MASGFSPLSLPVKPGREGKKIYHIIIFFPGREGGKGCVVAVFLTPPFPEK